LYFSLIEHEKQKRESSEKELQLLTCEKNIGMFNQELESIRADNRQLNTEIDGLHQLTALKMLQLHKFKATQLVNCLAERLECLQLKYEATESHCKELTSTIACLTKNLQETGKDSVTEKRNMEDQMNSIIQSITSLKTKIQKKQMTNQVLREENESLKQRRAESERMIVQLTADIQR
jgi:hypothetical protein